MPVDKIKEKKEKKLFASLTSLKKGVGSGVGSGARSGSISQRYGSGDPDPHQYVMDPPTLTAHTQKSRL